MTEYEKMIITKYDLMFEQRLTRVEADSASLNDAIREIKHDLRWMLGIMLGFSGIMLGLMAHGFHWI